MSKLSYEEKIEIYNKRKSGVTVSKLSLMYGVRVDIIKYLVRLIDKHGFDILRTNKNKKYSVAEKEQIMNRILLNNESACSVAIDEGLLSQGMLQNWIKNYKDMGYNIVERKRGRSSTMNKKPIKVKKDETQEEIIKKLEEENLYLKAELEYSKKLRAVVQARKNQQQKKK